MIGLPHIAFLAAEPVIVVFGYTDHRGEASECTVEPNRVWWGIAEGYPEPQWLMEGFDLDGQEHRIFAMRDMTNVRAG